MAILVILGVPGPIFGIGFGCLINNLLISTLVVTTGKLLGDIITYYLIKFWVSRNPAIQNQYVKDKQFLKAFKQIVQIQPWKISFLIRLMEVPPFLKNYLLAFFGVDFVPFIVPSLIITPPYIV